MIRSSFRFGAVALVFLGLAGIAWARSYTVAVASAGGTQYLTDSKGMTLYYFTKDNEGTSVCYGGCEKAWPVFYTTNISVPSPLNASDFGTITRNDGSKQTTYKGWPLYYWAHDSKPGDRTGEGVRGVWYILPVPMYTVMLATSPTLGDYLTDANGMTLYYYTKDSPDTSVCTGGCVQKWPVFYAPNVVAPSALSSPDFGTITRSDGVKQTTYKGYPLYYWVNDSKRGDMTGQDVGHVWYVVDPKKFPPKM